MKRDFFAALSTLAGLAEDPEAAGLAAATLEHCVEELAAMVDEAEDRAWCAEAVAGQEARKVGRVIE